MQKNRHPQLPPTQGTVPCVISQSTRIPAASAPCTQLQQPQGQHPENSQEDFHSYHQPYTRPHLNVYAASYTPQSQQMYSNPWLTYQPPTDTTTANTAFLALPSTQLGTAATVNQHQLVNPGVPQQ